MAEKAGGVGSLNDDYCSETRLIVSKMKTYLDIGEIESLEKAADNLRDCLLVRLLGRLGCRISEELGITVEDVDFSRATITIQHLKTRLKLVCPHCRTKLGKAHVYCPRCGERVEQAVAHLKEHRRVRTLPVDNDTLQMIREYIDPGGAVVRGERHFLFKINRHRAWQIIKDLAEKAGLPKLVNPETGRVHNVSPHRIRDSFAVNAVKVDDSGDGLRLLQEHLGHTSFNTTARYRKVAGEEHRQWYQRLWDKKTNGNPTNKA